MSSTTWNTNVLYVSCFSLSLTTSWTSWNIVCFSFKTCVLSPALDEKCVEKRVLFFWKSITATPFIHVSKSICFATMDMKWWKRLTILLQSAPFFTAITCKCNLSAEESNRKKETILLVILLTNMRSAGFIKHALSFVTCRYKRVIAWTFLYDIRVYTSLLISSCKATSKRKLLLKTFNIASTLQFGAFLLVIDIIPATSRKVWERISCWSGC